MFSDIREYAAKLTLGRPRQITFIGPTIQVANGNPISVQVNVHVTDGDVAGILEKVFANGGIGQEQDDGTFLFLPWPCAAVLVREVAH